MRDPAGTAATTLRLVLSGTPARRGMSQLEPAGRTEALVRRRRSGAGPPRERSDAGGDHHSAGAELFAVVQPEPESIRGRLDPDDAPPVQVRRDLLLKPLAVPDEVADRKRPRGRDLADLVVAPERQAPVGVADLGGGRTRAEEHALRHVPLPEFHRLPEDPGFDASGSEMRRGGQAV